MRREEGKGKGGEESLVENVGKSKWGEAGKGNRTGGEEEGEKEGVCPLLQLLDVPVEVVSQSVSRQGCWIVAVILPRAAPGTWTR